MNKQFAIGNLAKAATVTTINDRDMLAMTVACNDGKEKDTLDDAGNVVKEGRQFVEFIPAVIWGKKGAFDKIKPYLGVGQGVSVFGELAYPEPNEKDGVVYQNVLVEVRSLRDLRLIGGNKASKPADQHEGVPTPSPEQEKANEKAIAQAAEKGPSNDIDSFDDDIPF